VIQVQHAREIESDGAWAPEQVLDSWKEIAAYLRRDVRTVRRWEQTRGLPVHRLPGEGRAPVFAVRRELDRWRLKGSEAA
jgi:hypothetical protein